MDARQARNRQRAAAEEARHLRRFDEDIRAIKRLIKRYTQKRDWEIVRALFYDLGQILEEQENGQ